MPVPLVIESHTISRSQYLIAQGLLALAQERSRQIDELVAELARQLRCPGEGGYYGHVSDAAFNGIDLNYLLELLRVTVDAGTDWREATLADISGRAIGLAKRYLRVLDKIEKGGDAARLDAERSDLHDQLIYELQSCGITGMGIDFDGRANAAELARRIDKWLRD